MGTWLHVVPGFLVRGVVNACAHSSQEAAWALTAAEPQVGSSGLCFESFSQECLQPLENAPFRNGPSMWSSENALRRQGGEAGGIRPRAPRAGLEGWD